MRKQDSISSRPRPSLHSFPALYLTHLYLTHTLSSVPSVFLCIHFPKPSKSTLSYLAEPLIIRVSLRPEPPPHCLLSLSFSLSGCLSLFPSPASSFFLSLSLSLLLFLPFFRLPSLHLLFHCCHSPSSFLSLSLSLSLLLLSLSLSFPYCSHTASSLLSLPNHYHHPHYDYYQLLTVYYCCLSILLHSRSSVRTLQWVWVARSFLPSVLYAISLLSSALGLIDRPCSSSTRCHPS